MIYSRPGALSNLTMPLPLSTPRTFLLASPRDLMLTPTAVNRLRNAARKAAAEARGERLVVLRGRRNMSIPTHKGGVGGVIALQSNDSIILTKK